MEVSPLALLSAAVFAPVIAGALTLAAPRQASGARTLLALLGMGLSVGALLLYITRFGVASAAGEGVVGFPFVPTLGVDIAFNPDALGLFFGLLVSGIGALIVLYARGYFGPDPESLRRFYPTLGLFATAMMGIVLADNMFALLIFWELTSVSSFLLIGWERADRKAVRLAVQAFIVTGTGGLALMGGMILFALATTETSLAAAAAVVSEGRLSESAHAILPWAFALIILGGVTKSAQWPFHFWLPGAMAAPTPVSAYLHSATMVKAGVYLFARLQPGLCELEHWWPTLVAFGAVTMLLGAWLALRSSELKKIFAYTTVSQLGLLTAAYGLAGFTYEDQPNLVWPITQILSHALYKAPLFMIAGAIMHIAGHKELHQLKGLLRSHPLLAFITLGAAYAMAAGPFTLGFAGKEAFLYQVYHAAQQERLLWIVAAMAVLAAAFLVAIFVRFLTTFAARPTPIAEEPDAERGPLHVTPPEADPEHHAHGAEPGLWGAMIWLPAAFLLIWQYVGGLAPALFDQLIRPVETHPLYWQHLPGFVDALSHPSTPLYLSLAAYAVGVALGVSPLWRSAVDDPHNRLFPATMSAIQRLGGRVYVVLQSGNFRVYAAMVFTALLLGLIASFLREPALLEMPKIPGFAEADIGLIIAGVAFVLLACGSAVTLPIVQSRVVRVLVLGAVGFSVTGIYLLYQAPDLALTQLTFEIISVILFLLVLRMLPEEPRQAVRIHRLSRTLFAAAVGISVGWLTLHVAAGPDADPAPGKLGEWFLAHSYEGTEATDGRGGGGDNVVNVILVDFRGYDTLGEITVLSIAAMGVFALLVAVPRPPKKRSPLPEPPTVDGMAPSREPPTGAQPTITTALFRASMRLILPLSLIFSVYLFFKGHNEPGGGFIAGLVASVALAVYRMAEGLGALKRLLPIRPGPLAACGMAVALITGLAPMLAGEPFLRSYVGYIPRMGAEPFHWASVIFFDVGVFIVVIAVSVGIINRLTEDLE